MSGLREFEARDGVLSGGDGACAHYGGAVSLEVHIMSVVISFKDWFDSWYVRLDFEVIAGMLRKNDGGGDLQYPRNLI